MKTTSPKSSDVRQWARTKGMDVGERGRLSPEVLAAYSAAHGGATVQPAAKKATKKTAAKKTAAKKTAAKRPVKKAPAKKAPATKASPAKAAPELTESANPVLRQPEPTPVVTVDSARVTELEQTIAKLSARLEQLEKAKAAAPKRGLFGGRK